MIQVYLAPVGEDREAALVEAVRDALGRRPVGRRRLRRHEGPDPSHDRGTARLKARSPRASATRGLAFLDWLEGDRFVFLGARVYEYPRAQRDGGYAAEEPLYQPEGSLGVLRDQTLTVLRRGSEPAILSPQVRDHLLLGAPAWWPSRTCAPRFTAAATWTMSGCAGTAPTASRRARSGSWACSPPRPTRRPPTRCR